MKASLLVLIVTGVLLLGGCCGIDSAAVEPCDAYYSSMNGCGCSNCWY